MAIKTKELTTFIGTIKVEYNERFKLIVQRPEGHILIVVDNKNILRIYPVKEEKNKLKIVPASTMRSELRQSNTKVRDAIVEINATIKITYDGASLMFISHV